MKTALCFILWLSIVNELKCSVSEERKLEDCENGTTKEYFDKKFAVSNTFGGETFDSYCYTDDLYIVKCCLEDWMGDSASVITSYTINELDNHVLWTDDYADVSISAPATWTPISFTGNSSISRDGRCVLFTEPLSGNKCEVQIFYARKRLGERLPDRNKVPSLDSDSAKLAKYIYPDDLYSFHYNIDKDNELSSIRRSGNIVNITVRTPEFHPLITSSSRSQWQMCYCVISINVQNSEPVKQCNVNSKYSGSQKTLVKEVNQHALPEYRPFNICVALTKGSFGSFSYSRFCQELDFSKESNSLLVFEESSQVVHTDGEVSKKSKMVMAALVIVCILLIGTLAHLSVKRLLKHWRKKRDRSRNTPEEESDYENPNYSLGGNPCQYSSRPSTSVGEVQATVLNDGEEAYRSSSANAVGSGDNTSSGYDTQISPSTSDYTSHTGTDNQSEDTTNEGLAENIHFPATGGENFVHDYTEQPGFEFQTQIIRHQTEIKWDLWKNRLRNFFFGATRRNKNNHVTEEDNFIDWYARGLELDVQIQSSSNESATSQI
ncbi:uncharacterized protein LOC142342675 isoform X3 [Convolutriloba macropyga]|uniref:uncharacterized protein LOC142342675 isoform X3 n=1 Tax=Convolutriloba macropyga TaxID=536237 RepID=UPI003F522016